MANGDELVVFLEETVTIPQLDLLPEGNDLLPLALDQPTQTESAQAVKLKVRDSTGVTKFRLGYTEPFRKLFDKYCTHLKVSKTSVKFVFDGDELDLDETPETLDVEDDDIIDVEPRK